jgi:hypothetical protein
MKIVFETPELWWRATRYSLDQVKVVAVSAKCVFLFNGGRSALDSNYEHFRRSQSEANDAVVKDTEKELLAAKSAVIWWDELLQKLKARV